jgi:energy-coupling factor transport system permease protein
MLQNISLGIYFPGNSLLHRLQARTKLLVLVWFVVCLTIANQHEWHFAPYGVVAILLFLAIALSGISPRQFWQRIWLLTLLAIIGAIPTILIPDNLSNPVATFGPFNFSFAQVFAIVFLYAILLALYILTALLRMPTIRKVRKQRWFRLSGIGLLLITTTLLSDLWLVHITSKAVLLGPIVFTRDGIWLLMSFFTVFLLLYSFSMLLTMTTTPVALIEGLTMLLTPLRWLRLPVDDFALMALLALRFVPTLIEEVEQLVKAQTSRGADLSHGTIRERLQTLASLLVPLMQGTLRRASELATALEARGYQVQGRQTPLHEKSLALVDYVVLGTVVLVSVGALML